MQESIDPTKRPFFFSQSQKMIFFNNARNGVKDVGKDDLEFLQ